MPRLIPLQQDPRGSGNHAAQGSVGDPPSWVRACSLMAGLIAALYGLAGTPLLRGWEMPLPTHDLKGGLALALVWAAGAGAVNPGRPLTAGLRLVATVFCLLEAVAVLAGVRNLPAAPTGPHLSALAASGLATALVILAATLWPMRRPSSELAAVATQAALALLWAICMAAFFALLPSRMLLDWLPLEAGLSLPAAMVLLLLTVPATARVYRQPAIRAYFRAREDRQIFTFYLAMLFGAICGVAMLVASLLTARVVDSVKPVLHHSASNQAHALVDVIARVATAADRAAAELAPGAPVVSSLTASREWMRDVREQLDPYGQVGVRVAVDGRAALTEGRFHDGRWPELKLAGRPGLSVINPQGLVLQVERLSRHSPGLVLTIQVRPFHADSQLQPTEVLGSSADVLLCADAGALGAQCLSRLRPEGLRMPLPTRADGQPWPIQRAWLGQEGVVIVRDPARAAAMVAYAPVGATGLGVVQKLMLAPLVLRLTDGVASAMAGLLVVAALGAGIWHRRAFPQLRSLRYAKARLQATLEHLPRGVLTLDAQGRIGSSNARAHLLTGRSASELAGRDVQGLVEPEAGAPAWQPVPGRSEATLLSADGGRIPVEVLVERFDFEGESCAVLIIRDLRRERAHRAELARWETIFRHAEWGVAASSEDGQRLELVNPAFARMHGYSVDELRQRPLIEVFAPEVRNELPAHIARIHALGHHRFESWHLRRDGSVFPVLIDATVVHDADGRQFRVVNVQDVSEQKRAQEAVLRSEALLQLVLKSLPVGVWIADREGRVVATNPAVDRLWNGPIALADGRPVGYRARRVATGQLVAANDYPMLRAIRTGQATLGELIEVESPDGSRRTLMNAAVPLVDADGVIQGAIAVNEDLTTLLRAEAAAAAARDVFESLFQSAALGMAV